MRKKILFAIIAVVAGVVAVADMKLMEAMESGDMKTAVALAKKTLANNPSDYDANLAMALHYEEQENYAEQAEHLKKCLKEDSDSPEAMNSLAMAYLNLGEIAKAEELAGKLEDYAREPSVNDSDDWPVLLRFKSGTKTVREITVADLVETGVADFKKCVVQADKIVIRDGTVNWDLPTDKDSVLCTITDPIRFDALCCVCASRLVCGAVIRRFLAQAMAARYRTHGIAICWLCLSLLVRACLGRVPAAQLDSETDYSHRNG